MKFGERVIGFIYSREDSFLPLFERDGDRWAKIFQRSMLLAMGISLILCVILWVKNSMGQLIGPFFVVFLAIEGLAWLMSKRENLEMGMVVFFLGGWTALTAFALVMGEVTNPILMLYGVIVGGMLVFGFRLGVLGLVGTILVGGHLLHVELQSSMSAGADPAAWLFWAMHMLATFFSFVIVDSVRRSLLSVLGRLKRTTQVYDALLDNPNDALLLVDLDYNIKAANKMMVELTGYSQEELGEMSVDDLLADSEQNRGVLVQLLAGTPVPIVEREGIRKDGMRYTVELNALLVRDEKGEPQYVQAIVRDVTGKKQMEGVLLEQTQRYRALFNSSYDAVFLLGFNYEVLGVNQRGADLLGYEPYEMVGKSARRLVVIENIREDMAMIDRLMMGKTIPILERQLITKDKSRIDVEANFLLVRGEDGEPLYIQCVARDVTERKAMERKLIDTQQRYQALFGRTEEAVFIVSPDLVMLSVNDRVCQLLGFERSELEGSPLSLVVAPDEVVHAEERMAQLLEGEAVPNFERTLRRKDGELVTVEVSVALVYGLDGEPLYAHNTARDMTERKKLERELTEYQQRYQALFDRTDEGVFIIGYGMVLLAVNDRVCQMLGYSREELEGMGLEELLADEEQMRESREVEKRLMAGEKMPRYESVLRGKDGGLVTVEVSSALVYGVEGEALYAQSIVRDISDQKRLEKQLKSSLTDLVVRAATDPLTEMHNRRTIRDYASNALRQTQAREAPFSLVMIDLDDLKGINDTYGHQAGDLALKYLARAMRANMRSTDSGGRWAGDEFLLVLPETDVEAAEGVANRLLKKLRAGEVVLGNGKALKVSISMGVGGSGLDGGDDLEAILDMADQAMYQAKADGRNCVRVFR